MSRTVCVPPPTAPPPPVRGPEDNPHVESPLDVDRSDNSATAAATAVANRESSWLLAVNSIIQQDNEVVDKWQRSMDVLLIFVSVQLIFRYHSV